MQNQVTGVIGVISCSLKAVFTLQKYHDTRWIVRSMEEKTQKNILHKE